MIPSGVGVMLANRPRRDDALAKKNLEARSDIFDSGRLRARQYSGHRLLPCDCTTVGVYTLNSNRYIADLPESRVTMQK